MMQLSHSTRIAVQFIIEDDTGAAIQFIAALTVLISWLVSLFQVVANVYYFFADWHYGLVVTAKIWSIWFNAFAYGLMGARL